MYKLKIFSLPAIGLLLLGGASAAQAHESYMDCFDNGDNTVTCQAGYDDGSPPHAGDRVLLKDSTGKTLKEGKFDAEGSFSFERPDDQNFMVIFMGSEIGHTNRVNAGDLFQR